MHCTYVTLHSGANGYIVKCESCEKYQLAFLSSLLTLDEEEYKKICQQTKEQITQTSVGSNTNCKSILLQTGCDDVKIILSPLELRDLHEMLEDADVTERTNALLQLFTN